MNYVSFVVDGVDLHYYQAELLLFSLKRFAKQPKKNILVHCTAKVDNSFIKFLTKNGYHYRIIEPFLDGKYCNKVQQLEAFAEADEGNVFLLDTDVFVLGPLSVPDPEVFCGKIVDAPNPPLSVIRNIFQEANILLPQTVATDWQINQGQTVATNFNGGFYYVPSRDVKAVSGAWIKWAAWLHGRPELFANSQQAIHTDQVSMALAVCETGIAYKMLASNYNCPIHNNSPLTKFIPGRDVSMLHYHREINDFGVLKAANASNAGITKAIQKANTNIAREGGFEFYRLFKKSRVQRIVETKNTAKLNAALSKLKTGHAKPAKIILHAGTPKTGTTSLQFFLAGHQDILLEHGYWYPDNYSDMHAPKHQWLVNALINNDVDLLIGELNDSIRQAPKGIHTMLLSSEGVYNHWFDFSQEAKSYLVAIARHFDPVLWLWLREPVSFMGALYSQFLKNPKLKSVACYGQDLAFGEMLQDEWFVKHLDYLGFIYEVEAIFQNGQVKLFPYQGDVVSQACKELGLELDARAGSKENKGFCSAAQELLRIINRYPLSLSEKNALLGQLQTFDEVLSLHSPKLADDAKAKQKINKLAALTLAVLAADYQVNFKSMQA